MRAALTTFAAGLLFGVGLVVSGMVDPRNVVGFLDFTGHWNPNLAGVMAGAIGVHALLLRRRGARPGWRPPTRAQGERGRAALGVDGPLLIGASVFGVGWGLAGYCPGPAIVSLGSGVWRAAAFVAAMIAGTVLADALLASRARAAAAIVGPLGRSQGGAISAAGR